MWATPSIILYLLPGYELSLTKYLPFAFPKGPCYSLLAPYYSGTFYFIIIIIISIKRQLKHQWLSVLPTMDLIVIIY